ncbi:glycosyl hydrolase catalytic core domain-containing protein [Rhizoctonia solani AG-1 IA]|uniref:Glycosyl hydrolase catalytic core domain-containing protein n=1 Tax=Thanatephorus cucumeris (strain AG1-IA) TaxID=983506 RepID=L8WKJ2_THACA|nr:glycosyl hydrolase catalytic core domain-containing protein [Rhizoctonia solani AG-1 IA]
MFICLFILLVTGVNTSGPNLPRAGGSKAGLGWGGGVLFGLEICRLFIRPRYYTWSPNSWVQPPPNLEFVPMLWGGKDASTFAKAVTPDSVAANGWTHILGMNEYDSFSWPLHLVTLPICGRPTSSLSEPRIQTCAWDLQHRPAVLTEYSGFTISSVTATLMGGAPLISSLCVSVFPVFEGKESRNFIQHINDYHNAFQRPIWVTEWACQDFNNGPQCSYNQIVEFLDETQTYMDNTDWVERYAWFGAMAKTPINKDTGLMDSSGEITDLGKQYMGSQAPMTHGGVMRLEFPFSLLFMSTLFVIMAV